jgi:phosphohistidine phosphatase SixA
MTERNVGEFEPRPLSRAEKLAFGSVIAGSAALALYDMWQTRKDAKRRAVKQSNQIDSHAPLNVDEHNRLPKRKIDLDKAVPKGSKLFVLRHGIQVKGDSLHDSSTEHLSKVAPMLFAPDRKVKIVSSPLPRAEITARTLAEVLESQHIDVTFAGEKSELWQSGARFSIDNDFVVGLYEGALGDKALDVVMITHEPVLQDFAEAMGNLAHSSYQNLGGYQFDNTGEASEKINVPGQQFFGS